MEANLITLFAGLGISFVVIPPRMANLSAELQTIHLVENDYYYILTFPCRWSLPYFIASLIIVISTCSAILLSLETSSL